jgi:hypothetical protein
MDFIKLHLANSSPTFVKVSNILRIDPWQGGAVVYFIDGSALQVKESPESIMVVAEAEWQQLLAAGDA